MEILNELNKEQYKATVHTDGPIMVLAGAGSGKTRVLTCRIAYLLYEKMVNPFNILAITFTNKATREMKERVAMVSDNARDVWVSTFHSFAASILRYNISELEGYGSNFSIYDEHDSSVVLKKIIENNNIDNDKIKKRARHIISQIKNSGIDAEQYLIDNAIENNDTYLELYNLYQKELKRSNALDFDDLLFKVVELFKNVPSVLNKYQQRFKYILVDEFQDTNQVQYEIIKLLSALHKNVFVVGDEDQSIYGWRGADIRNILDFRKDFPDVTIYKLEQKYRSTSVILDAANILILNNNQRIGKQLYTDINGGVRIEIKYNERDRDEAEYVATNIYALTRNSNYQYKDIAILVRLNALSRGFEQRLSMYNIPYVVYGGLKFYDRKEIKDLLAYLLLINNERDSVSFKRIVNFPKRGIGDTTIAKLESFASLKGISMLSAIDEITTEHLRAGTIASLKKFKSTINDLVALSNEISLLELVNMVIKMVDLTDSYEGEEAENRRQNIIEFVASVGEYNESNPNSTLNEYLMSVSLTSDTDTDDDSDNKVRIATVHSVKGLEFKAVFIVGMEEGNFPVSRAIDNISDMEEERRIAYVAITRAKERLYITYAGSRFKYNRYEYNIMSRFVKELAGKKEEGGRISTFSASAFSEAVEKQNNARNGIEKEKNSYTGSTFSMTHDNTTNITFKLNDKIEHIKFGQGMIIKLEGNIADVAFVNVGIKKLNLSMAPVKKI